jgi:hypothetical protein
MSFVQRLLSAQFTIGTGTFGTTGQNQVNISGLRMSARIDRGGGAALVQLSMDIWGMLLSDMNALSTLGTIAGTYRKNSVLVKAGDATNGMTTVFNGTIYDAYVDLSNQPEAKFHVDAQGLLFNAVAPAKPSSWKGAVDVATIMEDIAGQLGMPFEGNGVSVILRNEKLTGSLRDQAQKAVDDAGIAWNLGEDGTVAIWYPGQARQSGSIPLISKATGLVNYPYYQSNGIGFTTVFNPAIGFGKKVNVQSSQLFQRQNVIGPDGQPVPDKVVTVGGSGVWAVTMMNHRLDSLVPHGDWFTDIQCSPVGFVVAPG